MVTITIPNIYTTLYVQCDKSYCMQKEVTIPGEPGKQIVLDELSLSLGVAAQGATATSWITTDISGVTAVLTNWTEVGVGYFPQTATPGFVGKEGESVTLKWNLKTSNSTIRAKMKGLTYSYRVKDVETLEAECLVVIECENQVEADAIAESLADKGASVYTRKTI